MKAILVLEDGSTFHGTSIGAAGERIGEVILNTAVVGYQEIMTDSANAGKILVFTYPLIGNYGIAEKFYESRKCRLGSVVVKECSRTHSNWQAEDTFENFLKKERIAAISGVDTRTLAVKIRNSGEMLGIVSSREMKKSILLKKLKDYRRKMKKDFIKNISVKRITKIKGNPSEPRIAIVDLGILNSFIRQLRNLECNLILLPYNTSADKILGLNPDGLIISNGPEEDEAIPEIAAVVQKLLRKIPILGISAGSEIIYLALGGKLKKMKAGHHGLNYPVRAPDSYKGDITVQNHSFVPDERLVKGNKGGLKGEVKEIGKRKAGVKITLQNVNDNSIEEMESKPLKFICAQYYPMSPASGKTHELFIRFLKMVKDAKKN